MYQYFNRKYFADIIMGVSWITQAQVNYLYYVIGFFGCHETPFNLCNV